jgi:Protein of unknown function (DUF3568)
MNSSNSSRLRSLLSRLGLCLALGLLPMLTGCVVVAAGAVGAGAVVYVRGELEAQLADPYAKVVEATRAALKDLEFAKISEKKDAIDAEFIYRTALDKKVTIKLKKVTDKSVQVKIRVDLIGDEVLSNAILDKIKANL